MTITLVRSNDKIQFLTRGLSTFEGQLARDRAEDAAQRSEDARDRSEPAAEKAESARDIAAGYASDAVSQGNVLIYATVLGMAALTVPTGISVIRLNGYASADDGGGVTAHRRGSAPNHPGRFQSAGGVWWEYARGPLNPRMFGAKGDNATHDHVAINAAIQVARVRGGGIVQFDAGNYLINRSIDIQGCSNLTLRGAPGYATVIRCTDQLNGASSDAQNDIIHGLNFTGSAGPNGYPHKNVVVEDFYLDCALQNPSAVPSGAEFGYNLCGVEIMNVDHAKVRRVYVDRAFGNGICITTQDPRLIRNGIINGILEPVIEDCVFDHCCRGKLPSYAVGGNPGGIAGDCVQIGAAVGGRTANNRAINPGAPFIDYFNSRAHDVIGNYIEGTGLTPVGAYPLTDHFYQQTIGTIRSDFGLEDCTIADNTFVNSGGIFLTGLMLPNYLTGEEPRPGPQRCSVSRNKITNSAGRRQIAAPPIGPSGSQYPNDGTQSVIVYLTGGVFTSIQQRRGTNGTFAPVNLGPDGSVVLHAGDALFLAYSNAPTAMTWFLAPNVAFAAITINGGSGASDSIGQAQYNTVEDNTIINPGAQGVHLIDASFCAVKNNQIAQPGLVNPSDAILLQASFDVAQSGSQDNQIAGNIIQDSRSPKNLRSNYATSSPGSTNRNGNNALINNRLEVGSIVDSTPSFKNGNYGLGAA